VSVSPNTNIILFRFCFVEISYKISLHFFKFNLINIVMFKNKYFLGIGFFLFFFFFTVLKPNLYGQCNAEDPIPFIDSTFGNLTASASTSGLCLSVLGCGISNVPKLTDSNLTDFATATTTIGLGVNHKLRVTDSNTVYSAGTFAGYRIAPSGGLLSLDLLKGISIKTYQGGVLKETFSGTMLLSISLLSNPGDFIVGFNTNQSFDAIEISISSLVGVGAATDVYYAVIRNYCAGPSLDCNVATALRLPVFPVGISSTHTGMSGISVGSISDPDNVTNSSTTDFAAINLTVGLLASGSIAVKDPVTDYPAGTYAGFEIENSNLVSLSALGNLKITTYLNGVVKEQFSANNLLANGALLNSTGRYKLGFVTTTPFD
jgi:hypothetical protein